MPPTFSKRIVQHCCAFALLYSAATQTSRAQQIRQNSVRQPAAALIYEAELDMMEGTRKTMWYHAWYDRGKYRYENIFPGAHLTRPVGADLYNASKPYIVWGIRFDFHKAGTDFGSAIRALEVAAGRDGVEAVRRRYHIPASFRLVPQSDVPPRLSSLLNSKSDFPLLTAPPVGRENVAGYACDIYESRKERQVQSRIQGVLDSTHSQRIFETRAWIEPRTGLVLRLQERDVPAASSPMPPRSTGYLVTKLRLPISLPASLFELPPGTTAYVPRVFGDFKLPPGVKRVLPDNPKGQDIGGIIEP